MRTIPFTFTGHSDHPVRAYSWLLELAVLVFFLCITINPVFGSQATLAWDANTESNLGGYRLYLGNSSRNYTLDIDVGLQTNYTVTNLQEGQTYFFAVTAYDTSGAIESAYSNEVSKTITAPDDSIDPNRVTDGQIVLYTFTEGSGTKVRDVSDIGTSIDLTISDMGAVRWLPGGGLAIDSPTVIRSASAATKVRNALQASQALSLEIWAAPSNNSQNGPARIIALSQDGYPSGGNFMLGQSQMKFEFRLRTTATDHYGKPALAISPIADITRLSNVLYTRDAAGKTRIYINGVEQAVGVTNGDFSNWGNYALSLANEPNVDQNGVGRPWLGELYLVALYDRALTATEAYINFTAGFKETNASDILVSLGDHVANSPEVPPITAKATTKTSSNKDASRQLTASVANWLTWSELPFGLQQLLLDHYTQVHDIQSSADGTRIVFNSDAPDLVPNDTNGVSDIFLYDTLLDQLRRLNHGTDGKQSNGPSYSPRIDGLGQTVVFISEADNLVSDDTNAVADVFLYSIDYRSIERVSQDLEGYQTITAAHHPALDEAGSIVLYDRADVLGQRQIYSYDTFTQRTEQLSLEQNPYGDLLDNHRPGISVNGRYVVYLEQTRDSQGNPFDCAVHVLDRNIQDFVRQICPEELYGLTDPVPMFSPDGLWIEWRDTPIVLKVSSKVGAEADMSSFRFPNPFTKNTTESP